MCVHAYVYEIRCGSAGGSILMGARDVQRRNEGSEKRSRGVDDMIKQRLKD